MREGGHNFFGEDPGGFNRILEQFLGTVAVSSS
jgi:pimeloyl-ACP methyl ester carboxylesterase